MLVFFGAVMAGEEIDKAMAIKEAANAIEGNLLGNIPNHLIILWESFSKY
jgi:hypothetical protein